MHRFAAIVAPPIAAWIVLYGLFDRGWFQDECWRTLTVTTPPMSCSSGFFLIGAAVLWAAIHLLLIYPYMVWIESRLRAGKTDRQRLRRRYLITFGLLTPIGAALAVAMRMSLRDFFADLWIPGGVDIALALAIVAGASTNDARLRPETEV